MTDNTDVGLRRKPVPKPIHRCQPPGFFKRVFTFIVPGDMWRCPTCKTCFVLSCIDPGSTFATWTLSTKYEWDRLLTNSQQ